MKALSCANYLVYLMRDFCDDLTNMKLNKLLYYAQGHYLQRYGKPMFDDQAEAWEHGPVYPEVYARYKGYGDAPITKCDEEAAKALKRDAADVLFETAREYGRYSASVLRNMTHEAGGPWETSYRKGAKRTVIPLGAIRTHFTRDGAETLHPFEPVFTKDDFIGYRDENGILVLPADWDDEAEAV